ncbi:MAG: AsmA-like C-terminal domain-containing protein [Desulforhopalus sp.]
MSELPDNKKRRIFVKVAAGLIIFGIMFTCAAGLLLKTGVSLNSFELAGVKLSGFTLVWRDKLELQVESFVFDGRGSEGPPRLAGDLQQNLDGAKKAFKVAPYLIKMFSSLHISSFSVDQWRGAIHLDRNAAPGDSFVTLGSKDLEFQSEMKLTEGTLILDINKGDIKIFDAQATGQVRIDSRQRQVSGSILVNFADVLPISLEFTADKNELVFTGKEGGRISAIKPLVDLFKLDQDIQVWITEYLVGSRYNLKTISGKLPWDNPGVILDTLYGEVRVDDCEYSFATGLEPIKTRYTDVVFDKGVLVITPFESTFYGQGGEESWLDIDFNDADNITLTAYIKTHAKANDDILNLLKYYDILLPFKQTAGKTKADLTLAINLNLLQVEADGTFLIDEGKVAHNDVIYDVRGVAVSLDDSLVTIENINARYGKLFNAKISGMFRGLEGTGELDIIVENFESPVGNSRLRLDTTKKQPTIVYRILQDSQFVEATASSWYLDEQQFNLGPFSSPFSFEELSGTLPTTRLKIPPGITAEISGPINLSNLQASLQCKLLEFRMKGITLETTGLAVNVEQNRSQWRLQTEKPSYWSVNEVPVVLEGTEFIFTGSSFSLTGSRVSYGELLNSKVTGYYDTVKNHGLFLLENLVVREEKIGKLLDVDQGIWVEISKLEKDLAVNIPELDISSTITINGNWSTTFKNLSKLHYYSPLLRKYMVESGTATVWSLTGDKPISFSAVVPYRYPILIKDGKEIEQFLISGSITDQGFEAMVNENLQLDYTDRLVISSKDIHYNIPAINNLLKDQAVQKIENDNGEIELSLSFTAERSSLVFTDTIQALADEIHLYHEDGRTVGHLHHGTGSIELTYENKEFSFEGKDLNDEFMEGLLQGAKCKNGRMSLAAQGTLNKASALFKVEDTLLMDFKPLNNMLAFINTIPALITFSPQEYSTKGLPVSSAITGLVFDGGVARVETFALKSPVITMNGAGEVDFTRNQMDMDFNLITQAKVNINKIPLLGYIFAGKEKRPSITLNVSGGLDDPKVEYSVFREVATLPFSILYRTLTLPYHLVDTMVESNENFERVEVPPVSNVEQGGNR